MSLKSMDMVKLSQAINTAANRIFRIGKEHGTAFVILSCSISGVEPEGEALIHMELESLLRLIKCEEKSNQYVDSLTETFGKSLTITEHQSPYKALQGTYITVLCGPLFDARIPVKIMAIVSEFDDRIHMFKHDEEDEQSTSIGEA